MLSSLHFLQPLWLLALIPLAVLLWFTSYSNSNSSSWTKVIDPKLLPLLLQGEDNQTGKLAKWLLGIGWLVTIIALADPVWEKIPRPVFQTNTARVIVLDLSNSMLVDDLIPSRMARARFKIEDILSKNEEGQTGLVVFAGDAFTASPLTRDSDTIRSLLQVLTPQIMPSQGSRVDLGLKKAHELLTQADVSSGQVLLIADGVSNQTKTIQITKALEKDGHTVSVLGVGTEMGAKLNFRRGKSVEIKLETNALREIAYQGSGRYHQITSSNADLKAVVQNETANNKNPQQAKTDDLKSHDWKSTGPFIIFLLLPIAALAFRKGWLLTIFITASLVGLVSLPQPVMALSMSEALSNTWVNLWKTKEQQASNALQNKQYDKASELAEDPFRRGSAHYKKGDYKKALEDFKKAEGAKARYNEGNTLARLEKFQEAIDAYDKALKLQPKMEDAEKNKALIQDLLKKKQKKESEKGENKEDKKEGEPREEGSGGEEGDGEKGEEGQGENGEGKEENNKGAGKENAKNKNPKNQFSDANKQLDKKPENSEDAKPKDGEDKSKQAAHKDNTPKGKAKQEKSSTQKKTKEKGTKAEAEELNDEEKMAAEQWLRRIPDDPGGLLRRKFERQYQQRRGQADNTENPW